MFHRAAIPRALLAAICLLLPSGLIRAQLQPRPEHCFPSRAVADGIQEEQQVQPGAPAIIDAIGFENPSDVPPLLQELLIAAVREYPLYNTSAAIDELNEVGLRGALQSNGYFRAETAIKVQVLSSDSTVEHVSLSIHVDLGSEYRLGSVQFESVDADRPLVFASEELRELIPMHENDVFDTSKLRQAFENLKDLYGSAGYIDFTPVPNFDIDDEQRRINLKIEIAQEQLYRVGRIEFVGNNPAAEQVVKAKLRPGEPVDSRVLEELHVQNNMTVKNAKYGLISFRFDFSTCPPE
jgi:hypothetical protein